jgi:hypothetical protein
MMIKYIKAFIAYLTLLKYLKDEGASGLYRLKDTTELMIKRLEDKKTALDKILPEIEHMLLIRNISKQDLIKALNKRR